MRLAIKLGYSNVDNMLAYMTASQFSEWQRFYLLEPFGSQAEERHLATISMQMANYLRPKGTEAFSLSDFMLSSVAKTQPRKKSVEELYQLFG